MFPDQAPVMDGVWGRLQPGPVLPMAGVESPWGLPALVSPNVRGGGGSKRGALSAASPSPRFPGETSLCTCCPLALTCPQPQF